MEIIKLYLLRARYVKSTRREIEITLIIFIGVIFQCRCHALYTIANGNSCQCHAIQRRSADSLSSDRLSENSDRIPGSKFDTWHPTN